MEKNMIESSRSNYDDGADEDSPPNRNYNVINNL